MKRLAGFIGVAVATLLIAWFVMLLAGDVYPISYKQSLHTLCIVYLVTAFVREAK
jgi:CDP-diglyceride synthetase